MLTLGSGSTLLRLTLCRPVAHPQRTFLAGGPNHLERSVAIFCRGSVGNMQEIDQPPTVALSAPGARNASWGLPEPRQDLVFAYGTALSCKVTGNRNPLAQEMARMFAEQMMAKARERLATISDGAPVREAAALMSKPHTAIVIVCDREGGMVGVVTKTDLIGQISHCNGGGCMMTVDTIMTRDVIFCRPNDLLHDIWLVMKKRSLQRIPVVDQYGKPVGIIYARDALQNLLGEVENEEVLLRDYVMSVGYQ